MTVGEYFENTDPDDYKKYHLWADAFYVNQKNLKEKLFTGNKEKKERKKIKCNSKEKC